MRILFQGDSITDGNRGRGSDPNHIIGHSYTYPIAAYYGSKYPEKNYEFISRGVSGDDINRLQTRWQEDTINLKPDALSILIGVNDAYYHRESRDESYFEDFENKYRTLLKAAFNANPQLKLVILEPFTLNTGNFEDFLFFEKSVKQNAAVSKKLAEEFNAIFIPLQEIFDNATEKAPVSYWVWDSIHPTYNGHGLIAAAFIKYAGEIF